MAVGKNKNRISICSGLILLALLWAMPKSGHSQETSKELHPLTRQLLAADVHFRNGDLDLEGFDSYAASPGEKAFAAAIGPDGVVHAWGKA